MPLYKEGFEGEEWNFVDNSAKTEGLTEMQFLRKLCKMTVDVVKRLRVLESANEEIQEALEAFIHEIFVVLLTQKRVDSLTCVFLWSLKPGNGLESCYECICDTSGFR
ncbi:hypothetical protein PENANT_c038G11242 [Penicillium antarcticum]|uniref:Uncharacterized protein n=1 Tax=Penicillium antarcticum TaxID=416450 RepID=A0A1V6PT22_9EURO|nr:hypothetical protein PENANT_c038G11242 [Penicillium antarcticum]